VNFGITIDLLSDPIGAKPAPHRHPPAAGSRHGCENAALLLLPWVM
jgi:hypothetical protein